MHGTQIPSTPQSKWSTQYIAFTKLSLLSQNGVFSNSLCTWAQPSILRCQSLIIIYSVQIFSRSSAGSACISSSVPAISPYIQLQIIVQMENNSGALLYIDSAYISSKENNFFVWHIRSLFVTSLLIFTQIPPHTYIILVLAEKKIKIQNNADLTRNEASMGAEFLVKSALFCIFIFFCAKTSIIYVCSLLR